ncbi:hypothetical protein D7W82_23510 [Corallococcus sp. CA049B]|uniref:hypothetical protein n=1 Tax=Corallococcus sp. CA049B TaxID=2316730 RepID=UPI000EA29621|nr:hypothetical protein [Corallococcus sp. CA049B]RKG84032.1 hypothetical protein D7W82_23510 [Corallococcus sp. CA049B]
MQADRKDSFEVRTLTRGEEFDAYRRLLFEVYIEEAGWNFNPANPSGIRISDRKLLDDRDDFATCFGVFRQDVLVGGGRICGRFQGRFEVHGYQPDRDLGFLDIPNLFEASRAALRPDIRGSDAFPLLVLHIFEYCKRNRLLVFTAPSVRSVMRFYHSIGMPAVEGCRFRFEPEDPAEAQLFLVDSEDVLDTVLQKLRPLLRGG